MEKVQSQKINIGIWNNPPGQYRAAPFWAWNTKLDAKELLHQIDCFYEMGLGGFFMHSRAGMATEYLGKEFINCVRLCAEYAKKKGMVACLYDEDRWPSGFAGGFVTREKTFRQKQICVSKKAPKEFFTCYGLDERDPYCISAYDIVFDQSDRIHGYKTIDTRDFAEGEKWYAYVLNKPCCGYHNGYTYTDTFNPAAVDTFIETTHEKYKREVGELFGKTIPAIFTDEPNYGRFTFKKFARDGEDTFLPWSECVREAYTEQYNDDIVDYIPELVWNLPEGEVSSVRYRYYKTISNVFATSYCDRIGKWCSDNGIALTGHVLDEPTLSSQMCAVGDAMRCYKNFDIPGVDMLCNDIEFTTVKQAQSIAHQYGRKGVMSELYGVSGWDFDFRGHKFQGDWQAALGVTLRVQHLAWLGMAGSAKRDYPASIGCQSAWYREYSYIENHFARLNVALTQGEPVVNVAVLHPIESAWLTAGVCEQTADERIAMDERFKSLTEWLLRGQIDFDYVCESLLAELYSESEEGFCVGKMKYSAIVVPPVITLRKTMIDALLCFADNGGKVIVSGDCPEYADGEKSDKAAAVWEKAKRVNFTENDILESLQAEREVAVYDENGGRKRNLIYTMRVCGGDKWLFIAHCDMPVRFDGADCVAEHLTIRIRGEYDVTLYDTVSGAIKEMPCSHTKGYTTVWITCYAFDSLLFELTPRTSCDSAVQEEKKARNDAERQEIVLPDFVEYALAEPNVLVLDMCEWSLDGIDYTRREEVLKIDKKIRETFGYPIANGEDVQPWCVPDKTPDTFVYLKFIVECETDADCLLGFEQAQSVWLNGKEADSTERGFYVDRAIHTMPLPPLHKGKNELVIRAPVSERVSLENYFLLGDFGVRAVGSHSYIVKRPEKISFGSVVNQGLPFYGAGITYKVPFACDEGDITVTADEYAGALIAVRLDGKEVGKIVLPPYEISIPYVPAGKHILELTLYASRINTFGALHLTAPLYWKGPNMWYTENNLYSEEYRLTDIGIMKKPKLQIGLLACRKSE